MSEIPRDDLSNEQEETGEKTTNHDLVQVLKKERPTRNLNYDRPDGDDGKMIGSPITYGSRSKKNTTPSRQRYQGD